MGEDFLNGQQVAPITEVWLPFFIAEVQTTSTLRMCASVLEALAHELNAANSYTQAHKDFGAMQMTGYDLCFSLAEVLSDLTEAQHYWSTVLLSLKDLREGEDSHLAAADYLSQLEAQSYEAYGRIFRLHLALQDELQRTGHHYQVLLSIGVLGETHPGGQEGR